MNPAHLSKINWTAGATALASIAILYFEVPREYMPHIVVLIGVAVPLLQMVFRTWFTEKADG
jgi:hypothetical protein